MCFVANGDKIVWGFERLVSFANLILGSPWDFFNSFEGGKHHFFWWGGLFYGNEVHLSLFHHMDWVQIAGLCHFFFLFFFENSFEEKLEWTRWMLENFLNLLLGEEFELLFLFKRRRKPGSLRFGSVSLVWEV